MEDITKHIARHIAADTNCEAFALACQDERGRVFVQAGDELHDCGMSDVRGNMLYIRKFDNTGYTERKSVRQRGACNTTQTVTGRFRLVACWRCVDTNTLIKYLKKLVISGLNSYIEYTRKSIVVNRTNDDHNTIYRQEHKLNSGDVVPFSPGIKTVSIDFTLSYDYSSCDLQNIKIC